MGPKLRATEVTLDQPVPMRMAADTLVSGAGASASMYM